MDRIYDKTETQHPGKHTCCSSCVYFQAHWPLHRGGWVIQLNLKPDKLLPSVFTSRSVIAHDTLKADRAAQTLPLVFIVLILVRIVSWAHCTSVFHLGVRARGCEMMHTVLGDRTARDLREVFVSNISFVKYCLPLWLKKCGSSLWFPVMHTSFQLIQRIGFCPNTNT